MNARVNIQKMIYQLFFVVLLLCQPFIVLAQWAGDYKGTLQGEAVTLQLKEISNNHLSGILKDGYNDFQISAVSSGNSMTGTAIESQTGIKFDLSGVLIDTRLDILMSIEVLGQRSDIKATLYKQNVANGTTLVQNTHYNQVKFPSDAQHDPAIVGLWSQNETYNSGYGDSFMGGNFSQSMYFLEDGRLAEGGSSASISGSNYSGKSIDNQVNTVEGIYWFNRSNQLYLLTYESGKPQEVHLGKYYIESNHMLITGVNGDRLLLVKN
jgi:hypothetical protein